MVAKGRMSFVLTAAAIGLFTAFAPVKAGAESAKGCVTRTQDCVTQGVCFKNICGDVVNYKYCSGKGCEPASNRPYYQLGPYQSTLTAPTARRLRIAQCVAPTIPYPHQNGRYLCR